MTQMTPAKYQTIEERWKLMDEIIILAERML